MSEQGNDRRGDELSSDSDTPALGDNDDDALREFYLMLDMARQLEEERALAPVVFNIYCRCGRWLTDRGMSVLLVSDRNTKLFSTDLVCDETETGDAYVIGTCQCLIKGAFVLKSSLESFLTSSF